MSSSVKILGIIAASSAIIAVTLFAFTIHTTDPSTAVAFVTPLATSTPVVSALEQILPQTPAALAAPDPSNRFPAALSIPSIKLAAIITPVGTDPNGAMSVPTTPKTVGWYKDGTIPGDSGSAVLDAHLYLAFKTLKNIKTGAGIYVTDKNGHVLHFVVSSIKTYSYLEVPAETLFAQTDWQAHLNLVTCAGTWLPSQNTYNERLVVYATLLQ